MKGWLRRTKLRAKLGLPLFDPALVRLVRSRQADLAGATPRMPIAGVVFSFDRALQLHGLLSSYFRHVADPAPLTVLYRTTSDAHRHAYGEAAADFAGRAVQWIEERDFRPDLERCLDQLGSARVFFLVDDIVLTRPFAFADFATLDPARCIVSLRHGRQLSYHYALDRPMPAPPWREDPMVKPGMIAWRWRDGRFDWGYPLSVDGHVFDRTEILALLSLISYRAPNSLEHALQAFWPMFAGRLGVAYGSSRLVNIPCNRVQEEFANRAGSMDPEALLREWQRGNRMDIAALDDYPNKGVHEEVELRFVPRANADG